MPMAVLILEGEKNKFPGCAFNLLYKSTAVAFSAWVKGEDGSATCAKAERTIRLAASKASIVTRFNMAQPPAFAQESANIAVWQIFAD
jgi:hypothetical protein